MVRLEVAFVAADLAAAGKEVLRLLLVVVAAVPPGLLDVVRRRLGAGGSITSGTFIIRVFGHWKQRPNRTQ